MRYIRRFIPCYGYEHSAYPSFDSKMDHALHGVIHEMAKGNRPSIIRFMLRFLEDANPEDLYEAPELWNDPKAAIRQAFAFANQLEKIDLPIDHDHLTTLDHPVKVDQMVGMDFWGDWLSVHASGYSHEENSLMMVEFRMGDMEQYFNVIDEDAFLLLQVQGFRNTESMGEKHIPMGMFYYDYLTQAMHARRIVFDKHNRVSCVDNMDGSWLGMSYSPCLVV